jgi:UDP-glucose 4-epimerase
MRILVTGANGFIGKRLCHILEEGGHEVVRAVRNLNSISNAIELSELTPDAEIVSAFVGIDCVIHLAAKVHAAESSSKKIKNQYIIVNVDWVRRLASAASMSNVSRFVFVSTIAANGNDSKGVKFSELSQLNPQNIYSLSKLEAEIALQEIRVASKLEIVIVRPTLVYGEGVSANFLSLLKLVDSGIPLPFRGLHSYRSFLYVGNLVSAIAVCAVHPRAAGHTFNVSDGNSVGLMDLCRCISNNLGRRQVTFSLPRSAFVFFGEVFRQKQRISSLTNSLEVDSSKITRELEWRPPYSFEEGIERTVAWYASQCDRPAN